MLESMRYVGDLHPDGVKLQLLQVLKGTQMASEYAQKPFYLPDLEEYSRTLIRCLNSLPEDVAVHRITGDGPKKLLIAPLWCADKKHVLNTLRKEIAKEERSIYAVSWNDHRRAGCDQG